MPRKQVTMDWKSKAKRLLGSRTIHLEGDGPFAVVTPCRRRTFSLWATRAEAEEAMNRILSCGGDCHGIAAHYIADLGEPKKSTASPEDGTQDQPDVKQTAKSSVC